MTNLHKRPVNDLRIIAGMCCTEKYPLHASCGIKNL